MQTQAPHIAAVDWNCQEVDSSRVRELAQAFKLQPAEARVLATRGLGGFPEIEAFLSRDLATLHDPLIMVGMEHAAERVAQAVRSGEKICVYGDYDVDGITGTAMMMRMLGIWKANIVAHIPNRFTEGYGLNPSGIRMAMESGATLMVTIDCGVTAVPEIRELKSHGIDVIVTDHHEPSRELGLPDAYSVLNPKVPECAYPDPNLCGSAMAYKLLESTARRLGKKFPAESLRRLVAIGTVADVVPLLGENRVMVHHGLADLHETVSPGLRALFKLTRIAGRPVRPFDVGYVIGPRLNAAGRMDHAQTALELFLTDNETRAQELAEILEHENSQRRHAQENLLKEATYAVGKQCGLDEEAIVVVAGRDWHEGVLGIVASKLKEQFHRPCLVISINGDQAKGSGRSIPQFQLHECMRQVEGMLVRWGGHSQAVGFSLDPEQIDAFRRALNEAALKTLQPAQCRPSVDIDTEVGLDEIDEGFMAFLARLEPFGTGNQQPVFQARGVHVIGNPYSFGMESAHLRFQVADSGRVRSFPAVAWRGSVRYRQIVKECDRVDLAFQPVYDEYKGRRTLTLHVKAVRPADS